MVTAGAAPSVGTLVERGGGAPQGRRQVAPDAVVRLLGGAPEQNHDDERLGATYERVYQGVLMHPVDLSEEPTDPVAFNTALGTGAGRKPDLKRHVVPEHRPVHDAVQEPHAALRDRPDVVAGPVKEGPDQVSSL